MVRVAEDLGYDLRHVDIPDKGRTVRTLPKVLDDGVYLVFTRGMRHVASLVYGEMIDWSANRLHRVSAIYEVVKA